jgi:hypothetical protein
MDHGVDLDRLLGLSQKSSQILEVAPTYSHFVDSVGIEAVSNAASNETWQDVYRDIPGCRRFWK